ncbi:MAG TPA: XrtA/PEP-CTERM system histidine kinase PrsK [Sphingomicrobium sp.]|nr:XrtA/PEP-CTERM system histidine kinase PrsK [Sphingomicrobium sp.]
MQSLIAFWSYTLAACAFASVVLWRARSRGDRSEQLLLTACAGTAVWAMVAAVWGRTDPMTMTFGTLRNLLWIVLLYDMSSGIRGSAGGGLRLVFAAVALSLGLHFALSALVFIVPLTADQFNDVLSTASLLRVTTSAGALVLVHNIYGQAAPQSRIRIRGPMLGLTLMWGYDLNLATLGYLQGSAATSVDQLFQLRGLFMAMTAPLFAATASLRSSLRVKLSRAATFQSLSLLGICIYLATMAALATAFRRSEWEWATASTASLLITMIAGAAALGLSRSARGWIKVKLAKHLFEHRYDYRIEWLRFTDTLGRAGADAAPLGDRIVKAFADIVEAPGGVLLVAEAGGSIATAASWNWPGPNPSHDELEQGANFWSEVERRGRIIEFEALRNGWGAAQDRSLPVLQWMLDESCVWAGIPLIHHQRLVGIVLLAAPEYRRPLDWEDFDLLRTAGRQAASSLAEAHTQDALSNAQRFEEFNRRFAFILHDVKNLVSQLSLLSRNAERHADNPEFRADMVETLKSSVGKMNELLARLSPHSGARVQRMEAQPLRPILTAAIAAKRGEHEVQLIGDTNLWTNADGAALEQAIGHLIQNAVEACSSTNPITIRAAARDGTIAISIADKGVGMDPDFVRNQLFQPFSSSKPGGFGIGAFEARSLVVAMGGRLGVDSRPGEGTTFTILLPAAEPVLEPTRKRA